MHLRRGVHSFYKLWLKSWAKHALSRSYSSGGPFVVSEEVSAALHNGQPIVALETSILTHGMPYPENISTQSELEAIVRSKGAVPATIGVHAGTLHVGIAEDRLESMAKMGTKTAKISRRDLPAALCKGLSGGTTVSATMVACNRAGIQVFATGGIGGVHRGGESSLDISPDVKELGRTPVTVVSSGIKSILDITRTLEVLETEGVCVAAFGESHEFPAFFAARSGHQAPWRVADASEAASLISSRNALHLDSGILIAVPIPKEYEADGQAMEDAVQQALRESEAADLTGNTVTPFILHKLTECTAGASLRANIALIKNNAAVAADIAGALAKIEGDQKRRSLFRPAIPRQPAPPVVVGGSVVDTVVSCTEDRVQLNGSTHAGHICTTWGGVGRNVADCLARLLADRVRFVSAVGADDRHAEALLQHNPLLDTGGVVRVEGARTASYCTLLDRRGDCLFGVGDMQVHRHISPQLVRENEEHIARAPVVIFDGNLPEETIACLLRICGQRRVPTFFEPTDVRKAVKPFVTDAWHHLSAVSPNLAELRAMLSALQTALGTAEPTGMAAVGPVQEGALLGSRLAQHIPLVLVTLGAHGALLIQRSQQEAVGQEAATVMHYPATKVEQVQSVSGAGDCLAGGFLGGLVLGLPWDRCMGAGMMAARRSLMSSDTVPETVGPDCLDAICTPRPVELRRLGETQ
ncbi:uncharacterized protein LOC144127807 [Amblyomma americanum]